MTLRSFNRNFQGRTGTKDARSYLASPETCAISALTGYITDPRRLGEAPHIPLPERYVVNDTLFTAPAEDAAVAEIRQGPNIGTLPLAQPLGGELRGEVAIKVADNITTDHILPGGERIMRYRSNLPKIAEFTFEVVDPTFAARAKQAAGGIIVGGANYGQGSSREHAALAPMYLGIRAVLVRSYARIHRDNLVNAGILPLTFAHPADYDRIKPGDALVIEVRGAHLSPGADIMVRNQTQNEAYRCHHKLSRRQIEIMQAGGRLNLARSHLATERREPTPFPRNPGFPRSGGVQIGPRLRVTVHGPSHLLAEIGSLSPGL